MDKEIWRDIKGYEGLYQVSNFGNLKSLNYLRTGKEHPLSPAIDKDGYLTITLCKNSKKTYKVHRLVAEAFLDKKDFKYVDEKDRLKYINNLENLKINHLIEGEEGRKNNCTDNIEWCTSKYNNMYGTRTERTSKKVYQYDLNGNLVQEWPSASDIERQLGYSQGHISDCCNGKRKTAYGYRWSYEKL